MEYYSDMRKEEILQFARTQMNLVDIIISEISQRKTDTLCSHLYMKSKKVELQNKVFLFCGWFSGAWSWRKRKALAKESKFPVI